MDVRKTLFIISLGTEEEQEVGRTVMIVVPYSFLNSLNRLPSTIREMTSRMSNGCLESVPTIP